MKRREFISGLGGAVAWPLALRAQQQTMSVIGWLHPETAKETPALPAFRQVLAELGYVEGTNLAIEYRWADGHYDRLPALAADLVQRRVAVIVTVGATATLPAKATTQTIPIVFIAGSDPIELGLVASYSRPDGDLTGVSALGGEMTAKRLELLHKIVPTASSIAMLVNPANAELTQVETRDMQSAARALGVHLLLLNVVTESGIAVAFTNLVERQAGALLISSAIFFRRSDQIISLAARHAIPTMFWDYASAAKGGLLSYGPDITNIYRQAGVYTGRILKGERPADLPVVQPTKFDLVLNLKTAETLGLEIPPTVLALADEVIE
jgi:putative tryptophan/tyrosine transport system substrate-binding protein